MNSYYSEVLKASQLCDTTVFFYKICEYKMERYIRDISLVSSFFDYKSKQKQQEQQQITFPLITTGMHSSEKDALLKTDNYQSLSSSDESNPITKQEPSLNSNKVVMDVEHDDIGDYSDDDDGKFLFYNVSTFILHCCVSIFTQHNF